MDLCLQQQSIHKEVTMSFVRLYPWNWFLNEPVLQNNMIEEQGRKTSCVPVNRLHDDIDRLFDQAMRGFLAPKVMGGMEKMFFPQLDLHTEEKQYAISIELPGVDADDVKLSLEDNTLVVTGEKKCEKKDEGKDTACCHQERVYGSFQRVLRLPEDADRDNISASHKNGVLTIVIPRKEPARNVSRQIAIAHA